MPGLGECRRQAIDDSLSSPAFLSLPLSLPLSLKLVETCPQLRIYTAISVMSHGAPLGAVKPCGTSVRSGCLEPHKELPQSPSKRSLGKARRAHCLRPRPRGQRAPPASQGPTLATQVPDTPVSPDCSQGPSCYGSVVEHHPTNQKVAGLSPSQGNAWSCGLDQSTSISFSPSPFL